MMYMLQNIIQKLELYKMNYKYFAIPLIEVKSMIVDAFPLGPHMVKPFCQRKQTKEERIFNYRLSRARRCSENAFGILAMCFRLFTTEIDAHPDKVAAACCLHNMLCRRCGLGYITPDSLDYEDVDNKVVPTNWREIVHLDPVGNRPTEELCKETTHRFQEILQFVGGFSPMAEHDCGCLRPHDGGKLKHVAFMGGK